MIKTRFHRGFFHVKTPGRKKFNVVMKEYEKKQLRDSHGNLVKNPSQAVAIAYSEARLHQSQYEKKKHVFDASPTYINEKP